MPGSLLERRPDLLAAERQVLADFRTLEVSKLALLPSITLAADGGRLDDRFLSLLNLNPTVFRSALQIYVPSCQGGGLRAQIKISSAQQEQALAVYGSVALSEPTSLVAYRASLLFWKGVGEFPGVSERILPCVEPVLL
jgi:outer membrane protein, multidrug efflux system